MTISELKRKSCETKKALKENPRAWWLQRPDRVPAPPAPRKVKWAGTWPEHRSQRIRASRALLTDDQKAIIGHLYLMAARLGQCTGIAHHVDHIVPIARGGAHAPSNLQVITAALNYSKGARL